ncbi:phosphotransferase family protein [Gorillibacterium massiliense]|uniref:phosphotransferase family protein n=1 Tax=Gorillibacterium massiliense TaxID=1280390 RepID=UPI0004BB747A|nr:aminoglycoside phosphotransferase family protein [Gorillibacterium massiliense]
MKLEKVIAVHTSKTVYHDGNLAIKVFDKAYSKADILNEALNHARVEETALHVPALLDVGLVEGKWAIVTEFVKGKTLARLMAEAPDRLEEYLELFVNLQVEVHAQKAPLLNKLQDKMIRKISETNLDATTRYDLFTRLDAMPKHNKVCHGDFNPTNILITEEGIPYILDWSHASQGNASADAAHTYMLFWLAGDIRMADRYMELFCSKSGTAKEYVQKWLPLVAAAQLVKGKPEEREFLLHWVNVFDYE